MAKKQSTKQGTPKAILEGTNTVLGIDDSAGVGSNSIGVYNAEEVVVTLGDHVIVGFLDAPEITTQPMVVSEEAFTAILDAIENPPEPSEKLLEAAKASQEALDSILEETNPTVSLEGENPVNESTEGSEGIVDTSDEGIDASGVEDAQLEPTNYILDAWERKIPVKDIFVERVYLTKLVDEVLYLASLGAVLDTSMVPQIARVPFRVKMKLPEEVYDTYIAREDIPAFDEDKKYLSVSVSSPDRSSWIKKLIELGKTGAIVQPKRLAVNTHGFSVPILTRTPVAYTLTTKINPEKLVYTKEELSEMSVAELRVVGGWYDLTGRSKPALIKDILTKQEDK